MSDIKESDVTWESNFEEAPAPQPSAAPQVNRQQLAEQTLAEYPAWQRGLIGAGKFFSDIGSGVSDLATMAGLSNDPARRQQQLAQLRAEKEERGVYGKAIEGDTAANLGNLGARIATAAAGPARLGAQVAMEGAISALQPSEGVPETLGGELGGRALQGGRDALITGVLGKGIEAAGTAVGAMTGKLTRAGKEAKALEEAAERMGVPRPSFGQVYPGGTMATIEQASTAQQRLIDEQAEALYQHLAKKTPYGVDDVGGKYLDELKGAVAQRYALGAQKYKAVDDVIQANGLQGFMPTYTARTVTSYKHPGFDVAARELEKYGFPAASMVGMKASDLGKIPLSFENFNTMRIATNKAWNNVQRDIDRLGTQAPKEIIEAKKWLNDLRKALDNDADKWAKVNAKNGEAVSAYRDATQYWKEQVVPTVVANPFARKLSSQTRGFPTGESGTRLSLSTANMPLVDRLLPTMSDRGVDMTSLLRRLPEVRARVLSDEVGQTPRGALHAVAQAVEGPRSVGTVEKLMANAPVVAPGLRWLTGTTPVRRLVGAEDVLRGTLPGRVAYGALQVPVEDVESRFQVR